MFVGNSCQSNRHPFARFVFGAILFAVTLLMLGPIGAEASTNSCADVWAPIESEPVKAGVSRILEKDSEFPVIEVSEYLKAHYAPLNRLIKKFLGRTRDDLISDINRDLARMNGINDRLVVNLKRVGTRLNSKGLKKFVTAETYTLESVNQLIQEASFCRGRGEVCVKGLKERLPKLLSYHQELKSFAESLDRELAQIQEAATAFEHESSSVASAVARQRDAMVISNVSITNQLQLHRELVEAMISAIDVFELQLDGSIKMLMVTTPNDTPHEKELRSLHENEATAFDARQEQFERGDTVIVPRYAGYENGKVEDLGQEASVIVRLDSRTLVRRRPILVTEKSLEIALPGCFFGVCSGEIMALPSGLRTRAAGKDSVWLPSTFAGRFRLLGYNPVTHKMLFIAEDKDKTDLSAVRDPFWMDADSVRALKEGSRPKELEDRLGSESRRPTVGEVVYVPSSVVSDGLMYLQPTTVTELGEKTAKLKADHYHVKDESTYNDIVQTGCFGPYCSGEIVTVADARLRKRYSSPHTPYRVVGYNHERTAYCVEDMTHFNDDDDEARVNRLDWYTGAAFWVPENSLRQAPGFNPGLK